MAREDDEFEGIDIDGPWGGIRIGRGGGRSGGGDWDEDDEVRRIRRRVRRRLEFYRHAVVFALVIGSLALLDGLTGGGWWVQWPAGIWGAFLALQFYSGFLAPTLWGRDVEERMVRRELERRRGRVHVERPPSGPPGE
ncbi:MAG: 2TM domain-containing protein [Dehalococcoidia bacterium]